MEEFLIEKISNGYLLTYPASEVSPRYFETKKELFEFIDQIME